MAHDYAEQAKVMKAFCDENRLKILAQLKSGEQCACMLLEHLEIGQSALSYHMKILVESGVVSCRQDGKWMHYQLSGSGSKRALEMLSEFLTPAKDGYAAAAQCKPDAARG
ncbi:MAG: metalloregulator ArsR/SmtB family transcription factor [Eubacteriales bacterium]